jgi:hypothetical protein
MNRSIIQTYPVSLSAFQCMAMAVYIYSRADLLKGELLYCIMEEDIPCNIM